MQPARLNHLVFPLASPAPQSSPTSTANPNAAGTDATGLDAATSQSQRKRATPDAAPTAPTPGAVYVGDIPANLTNLPFDKLIELGHSKGVFTKITYNRNGTMDGKLDAAKPTDFVSGAVEVMRDLEEGIAALKGTNTTASAQANSFWSEGLRGIKQAAAKLNVFA